MNVEVARGEVGASWEEVSLGKEEASAWGKDASKGTGEWEVEDKEACVEEEARVEEKDEMEA